jgi:hypothetical protein
MNPPKKLLQGSFEMNEEVLLSLWQKELSQPENQSHMRKQSRQRDQSPETKTSLKFPAFKTAIGSQPRNGPS